MALASTPRHVLALLAGGTPLLLPNPRAAGALRSAFDTAQRSAGLTAWEPAPALSWTQWTANLWSGLVLEGRETRLLLNSAQEHTLWTEVVATGPTPNQTLGSPDTLADLARSAWHLAANHNALPQLRTTANTPDARQFAVWADAFSRLTAARNCLSSAQLNDALRQHVLRATLPAPTSLHLAGFETLLPAQQSLLEALRAKGTVITEHTLTLDPQPETVRATLLTANEREELTTAARWIRQFITQRSSQHHTPTVAVLVPNLPEARGELETAFREILAPELQNIAADLSSTPWEFPTGAPLTSLALISAALDLAHLALGPLPLPRLSSLLLSPYIGQPSDLQTAAIFDATVLRRITLLRPELTLPNLLALTNRAKQPTPLPTWIAPVHQFLQNADLTRPRTYADWTEFLRSLTRAANWPGDRPLTATEFEATRAWDSLLDLTATLDFTGRRVSLATALEALDRHARSTAFTPPTTNAPIQVMSPDDSAGTCFDAIVFLRATDANWPPSDRPNPLLSFALQRDLQMPGTGPSIAAVRAQQFTANLLARSSTTLFTSAAENSDGPQRPSPLLAHLPQLTPTDLLPPVAEPETIPLEIAPDDALIPALPNTLIRGGATVLKLQAACGFLAFAQLRLQSAELESRTPGFDARESGNLLHHTLQRFWSTARTRDNVAAMPPAERDALLTQSIAAALARQPAPQSTWETAYVDLQKERLRRLLHHWLDHELERGPFTVLGNEQAEEISVGPLTLQVRMDRIDQLEDGGVVFVDYKTGFSANVNDWLDDRPNDPQLPLYALLPEPGELKGLVFAKVRAGEDAKWLGFQSQPGIFPDPRGKTVADLDAKVADWRHTLTQLAEDFYAGRADVNPKSFEVNCTRCAQRLLCRVDPESLLAQITNSEEDEAAIDG